MKHKGITNKSCQRLSDMWNNEISYQSLSDTWNNEIRVTNVCQMRGITKSELPTSVRYVE